MIPPVLDANREVLLALLDQIESLLADVRTAVTEHHNNENEEDDQHGR